MAWLQYQVDLIGILDPAHCLQDPLMEICQERELDIVENHFCVHYN